MNVEVKRKMDGILEWKKKNIEENIRVERIEVK